MSPAPLKRPHLALVRPSAGADEPASQPRPALAFDDSELVRAVREGDASAAASLHDRLRPAVERTVRRLLGFADVDYEDIVQLSMIQIVESIDRFRGECSLDGWASSIAAHAVYKHIRRRRTERRLFDAFLGEELLPASTSTVGREASARSVLRRVLVHLSAIDEDKAYAFVLHDVCGFDLKEIARITEVSVSAAQTRLVRGRREVHERIAADPELADVLEGMEGGA
jgi:RNA polymerase sigma-70 factor, ECF subfamily